jgi:hypothetical protein
VSEAVRCAVQLPHRFHEHTADVEVHCLGIVRCGELAHAAHTFTETQRLWCPGICDCGMGRGLHGPGEHK